MAWARLSDALVLAVVGGAGVLSVVSDLRTRRIPNRLTFGIAALGLLLAISGFGRMSFGAAIAGFVLGLGLMLPGHLIGATGAGDVKLFAALGSVLGPSAVAMAYLYTAIAGGLLALIVSMGRSSLMTTLERTATLVRTRGGNVAEIEQPSANNRFAYAPAIALGTLAAAFGL
jgi:prepilin peptidase CpaA